jgi:site-specific DNA-methyltransferase (adenine-specific)
MTNERAKKYLLGLENKSILKKNSVKKSSVDLIITSPPYNVGIDYGSNEDNLTYGEYLNFSKI